MEKQKDNDFSPITSNEIGSISSFREEQFWKALF
jgi:hypothetical protein